MRSFLDRQLDSQEIYKVGSTQPPAGDLDLFKLEHIFSPFGWAENSSPVSETAC